MHCGCYDGIIHLPVGPAYLQRYFHSQSSIFFFFNDTATTEIYTLSLHDALPISTYIHFCKCTKFVLVQRVCYRSEEHTSELQSLRHLVCRLLLEKKNSWSSQFRSGG